MAEEDNSRNNRRTILIAVLVVILVIAAGCLIMAGLGLLGNLPFLGDGDVADITPTPIHTAAPEATVKPTVKPTEAPADETGEPEETSESTATDEVTTPTPTPFVLPTIPAPIATSAFTSQGLILSPIQGEVWLRRSGQTSFNRITSAVTVFRGDTVRTGASGMGLLTFSDTSNAVLYENTQVQIGDFARHSDGRLSVRLQQSTGRVYHTANFMVGNSSYEVQTPAGVAAGSGASFWTIVFFDGTLGMSPTQIAALIASNPFFSTNFMGNLAELDGLGLITADFRVMSGQLTIVYTDVDNQGQTVIVPANCQYVIRAQVQNGVVVAVEVVLVCPYPPQGGDGDGGGGGGSGSGSCGDGVCDPYKGEDSSTCPEDCP